MTASQHVRATVVVMCVAAAVAVCAQIGGTPALFGISYSFSAPNQNYLAAYDPLTYTPLPANLWQNLPVPVNLEKGMQQPVATFDQATNRYFFVTQSNEYQSPSFLWSIKVGGSSADADAAGGAGSQQWPQQLLNTALQPLPISNISIDGWWEDPGCVGYEPETDSLLFVYSVYDFNDSNQTVVARVDATTGAVYESVIYTLPMSNTGICVYDRVSHTLYGVLANTDTDVQDWYAVTVTPGTPAAGWQLRTGLWPSTAPLNHCLDPVADPNRSGVVWVMCSHYPGASKSKFFLSAIDFNSPTPAPQQVASWTHGEMNPFGGEATMDPATGLWYGQPFDVISGDTWLVVADPHRVGAPQRYNITVPPNPAPLTSIQYGLVGANN